MLLILVVLLEDAEGLPHPYSLSGPGVLFQRSQGSGSPSKARLKGFCRSRAQLSSCDSWQPVATERWVSEWAPRACSRASPSLSVQSPGVRYLVLRRGGNPPGPPTATGSSGAKGRCRNSTCPGGRSLSRRCRGDFSKAWRKHWPEAAL